MADHPRRPPHLTKTQSLLQWLGLFANFTWGIVKPTRKGTPMYIFTEEYLAICSLVITIGLIRYAYYLEKKWNQNPE